MLKQESLSCPLMPLAVYREVAAHLRQVEGVTVELLPPEPGEPFGYEKSQMGGLALSYSEAMDVALMEAILGYYGKVHGPWQRRSIEL